jgi:hypothetical protein
MGGEAEGLKEKHRPWWPGRVSVPGLAQFGQAHLSFERNERPTPTGMKKIADNTSGKRGSDRVTDFAGHRDTSRGLE